METNQLDQAKVEACAERVLGMLNGGAMVAMISIGHRTGLLDKLGELPPSTSHEIAEAAGLNERYVREWLGAMVMGRLVEYDAAEDKYSLPPEHAACLTRAASPENLSVTAQFLPILGTVEDRIVDCFQEGGGVSYEAYHRFHEVMAEDSGQTVVAALIDSILPLVPGLSERLKEGIDVFDIGCGRGRAVTLMARHFPASRFLGSDLSREAIDWANENARRQGLENVRFETRDLTTFDTAEDTVERFDLVTAFDAIHDQARPDRVLAGIHRALKPGGTYLMQDIAASSSVEGNLEHPAGPFLYTISCMHCMTVSLAQGGMGLGTVWGKEKALEMLAEAGFDQVEVKQLEHDFLNYYYITSKS